MIHARPHSGTFMKSHILQNAATNYHPHVSQIMQVTLPGGEGDGRGGGVVALEQKIVSASPR